MRGLILPYFLFTKCFLSNHFKKKGNISLWFNLAHYGMFYVYIYSNTHNNTSTVAILFFLHLFELPLFDFNLIKAEVAWWWSGGGRSPPFFLHNYFSWVEYQFSASQVAQRWQIYGWRKAKKKVSMILMASLAPAPAEVEAWAVAKADRLSIIWYNEIFNVLSKLNRSGC